MSSKSLIFCFDGTSTPSKHTKEAKNWFGLNKNSHYKNISNVLKLHIMFGGTLHNEPLNTFQHSFYYSGLATQENIFKKVFNASFAPENMDVSSILNQALIDLQHHYKEGDKIYVFGFSRGAAIARRFCAILHKYIGYDKPVANLVDFIGVFDTIASLNKPNLDNLNQPISDVVFKNGTISDNIHRALHLLSLDENAMAYQPTLMNAEKRVKEVWFSGNHFDIGGGSNQSGLSDITLDYMISEIYERQLDIMILDLNQIDFDRLKMGKYQIKPENLFIHVDYLAQIQQKEQWFSFSDMILHDRDFKVNESDMACCSKYPIVYYSVKQRIEYMNDYRPKALQNASYYIEYENSYFQTQGFKEYEVD